jgi:uncharacterized membrane protein YfcA
VRFYNKGADKSSMLQGYENEIFVYFSSNYSIQFLFRNLLFVQKSIRTTLAASFMITGYLLSVLVGLSLGMIGSGGSILTVPILVYIMGVDAVTATAYSLFIVGSTALIGAFKSALNKQIDFKTALFFGLPSIAAVYATRLWLIPLIPATITSVGNLVITKDVFLLLLFSLVMIAASWSMISDSKTFKSHKVSDFVSYMIILTEGIAVGVITGLVGAGGGFLIIPVLVIFKNMPMKLAVGTSLLIIAAKSLFGFVGDWQNMPFIDWTLLLTFTGMACLGIITGIYWSQRFSAQSLKKSFGWFVLLMGIYIIFKETIIKT